MNIILLIVMILVKMCLTEDLTKQEQSMATKWSRNGNILKDLMKFHIKKLKNPMIGRYGKFMIKITKQDLCNFMERKTIKAEFPNALTEKIHHKKEKTELKQKLKVLKIRVQHNILWTRVS